MLGGGCDGWIHMPERLASAGEPDMYVARPFHDAVPHSRSARFPACGAPVRCSVPVGRIPARPEPAAADGTRQPSP
jgi:hypothetical protein